MKPYHIAFICLSVLLLVVYIGYTGISLELSPAETQQNSVDNALSKRYAHFTPEQRSMIKAFSEPPVRMVCFAPGSDPAFQEAMDQASQIAQTKAFLAERATAKYTYSGSRWGKTATNGTNVGSTGEGLTLTWGIVPDGTIVPSNRYNATGPSNLRARLDAIYNDGASPTPVPDWLPMFQEVFDGWSAVTGITYVYEPNDDSAQIMSMPGELGVRPDIRIAGIEMDGYGGVLAYNFYPGAYGPNYNGGDMVIDSLDDYFNKAGEPVTNRLKFKNIIYHEHGHGLGMPHVCPVDHTKIMEPYLNLGFLGLQHDDIRAGHAGYGDPNNNNNSFANAKALSVSHGSTLNVTGVSIDKSSEEDFYSVSVGQTGIMRVVATPIGQKYLSGTQGNPIPDDHCYPGTLIDSEAAGNLAVTIYRQDQSTVVKDNDIFAIGQAENVQFAKLPATETYYIKVHASGASSVQMYDLDISLASEVFDMGVPTTDADMSYADISISGATVQAYNGAGQAYEAISDDIDQKRGYWVKRNPFSPDFAARPTAVGEVTYNLSNGWNLLSVPSDICFHWDTTAIDVERSAVTVDLATAAQTNYWVEDYAWIFNQSTGEYEIIYDSGVISGGANEIPGGQSFWFYSHVGNAILKLDVPASAVCRVLPNSLQKALR